MASHRLNKLDIENIELIGYSVAGEETVIAAPTLDVCFDIGKAPEQVIPINNVLLSHGHIDHTSGIAYYLSHRIFEGQKPGTVLVPKNCVEPLTKILDAWGRFDGNKIQANIVPVAEGDVFQIKPNLIARVFDTNHCYGSVGYSVIETRKKLQPQYRGLSGDELSDLKKQGITIDMPIEIPLITYLGDTAVSDYKRLDFVRNSKILIIECTFVEGEHNDRASAGKHMHIDNLSGLLSDMNNNAIIITHISQRSGIKKAKKALETHLPNELYEKTYLLMDRLSHKS